MKYLQSQQEGDSAESRFIVDYILDIGRPNVIHFADAYQNMREHWDVSVDDLRIDVKAYRRTSRAGAYTHSLFVFELQNVSGKEGWGLGKADAIAYEMQDSWLIVDRVSMADFIVKKLGNIELQQIENSYTKPYTLCRRRGRLDLFLWIPLEDMMRFKLFSVKKHIKQNDEHIQEQRGV